MCFLASHAGRASQLVIKLPSALPPSPPPPRIVAWDFNAGMPGSTILLQLVKVDKLKYALDFTFPFTAETAFATALAVFDIKMGSKVATRGPPKAPGASDGKEDADVVAPDTP